MWKVNGRLSFVAEEAGATDVTGVDIAAATPEFEAERERRDSRVRFVHGDLHDPAVIEEAGRHDVVWCSGVLYHSPNPVTTLRRLRELTGERLILQTTCVPELPGVRQGMVFYPGLEESERSLYGMWGPEARRSIGPVEGWDDEFGPWWWGITPSALRAMMRSAGLEADRGMGRSVRDPRMPARWPARFDEYRPLRHGRDQPIPHPPLRPRRRVLARGRDRAARTT